MTVPSSWVGLPRPQAGTDGRRVASQFEIFRCTGNDSPILINRNLNICIGDSGVKIDKGHRDYPMRFSSNPETRVHNDGQLSIHQTGAGCTLFRHPSHRYAVPLGSVMPSPSTALFRHRARVVKLSSAPKACSGTNAGFLSFSKPRITCSALQPGGRYSATPAPICAQSIRSVPPSLNTSP
jgi:hypothetical protein